MKPIIPLVAGASLIAGCAQHRLVVPNRDFSGEPVTVSSTAEGWVVRQKKTRADCPTNVIHEVRVKQNLLQSLATVATLGLWMPIRIRYQCGKRETEEGDTGDGTRQ